MSEAASSYQTAPRDPKWIVNDLAVASKPYAQSIRSEQLTSLAPVVVQAPPSRFHSSVPLGIFRFDGDVSILHRQTWYPECLRAIEEIDVAADEDEVERPGPVAKQNARAILLALASYPRSLPAPVIYPTEDREVAIDIYESGSVVSVHCASDGQAVCYSTIAGVRQRGRFGAAPDVLDCFLFDRIRAFLNAAGSKD